MICLIEGPDPVVRKLWFRDLLGLEIFRLEYWVVSLPDLSAEEFEALESGLAVALSALMRSLEGPTAERKLRLIERILAMALDAARRAMYGAIIDRCLVLSKEEELKMEQLLEQLERTKKDVSQQMIFNIFNFPLWFQSKIEKKDYIVKVKELLQ